jgi:hypothetical protein
MDNCFFCHYILFGIIPDCIKFTLHLIVCQEILLDVLEANNLSGVVAHNLSGLEVILEVTDETDRVDAGDPEDAI